MAERVMVFIDGQNLLKALQRAGRPRLHPVLLARHLARRRELVGVRYYSGVHQPRENPTIHALVMRRHKLMRMTGVDVIERPLRYHWEWSIDDDLPPPHRVDDGTTRRVRVIKKRMAREKGIDLALGLDAVTAALTDMCDTVVIVSRDRDLVEIAREINERARTRDVRVEVALVTSGREPHVLEGYDFTHWIDDDVIDACADAFDYRRKLSKPAVSAFLERVEA